MGLEAECTVEWKGRAARGKALLETEELLFRGTMRLKIPRRDITAIATEDGALRVTFGGETATFMLGPLAEKWARGLATMKSRLEKLGVKKGLTVSVVGVRDPSFLNEVRDAVGSFAVDAPAGASDLIFYGVETAADLQRVRAMKAALKPEGGLWMVRPKKGNGEVTEARAMAAGKAAGLVGVKVAAFSPTHTALKFVIPLADRARGAKKKPSGGS
jgi:hypothetical protein